MSDRLVPRGQPQLETDHCQIIELALWSDTPPAQPLNLTQVGFETSHIHHLPAGCRFRDH